MYEFNLKLWHNNYSYNWIVYHASKKLLWIFPKVKYQISTLWAWYCWQNGWPLKITDLGAYSGVSL